MSRIQALVPCDWEGEVAREVAGRIRARSRELLASGEWSPAHVRAEVCWAERRLTPLQRDVMWMSLVADVELAELMERPRARSGPTERRSPRRSIRP